VHPQFLQNVVAELQTNLTGKYLGKIFQLSPVSFAFDFGLRGSFLFVSVDPASPRMYLIRRRARDLEKQSQHLNHFGQLLKERLGRSEVVEVEKEPTDRIVRLRFASSSLLVQLTGRTAELFLLGEGDQIEAALRTRIQGIYQPPPVRELRVTDDLPEVTGSPSEAADAYFAALDHAREFASRANAVQSRLVKAVRQKEKLKSNLEKDLAGHGDPEEHKRIGDLLLANLSTATRAGNKVTLTDYYADGAPSIIIEVDENVSLQNEAEERFRQYGKAKRAREEIAERMVQIDREIAQLNGQLEEILRILSEKDETGLAGFIPDRTPRKAQAKQQPSIPGVRRYRSTDGYEILVGRASRDNDNLTFKVAQPNDLWLHTGDYPGSHVVVRNPTRKEIPHRTIIEAAQLAGRFSQASEDSKVVVHYTPRKFLSKPKGAAPGLVRLSRFRSITVEPKEGVERIMS
jgi:predicted ribosome quality control (RQC) complex YloA/Tae2 family protein